MDLVTFEKKLNVVLAGTDQQVPQLVKQMDDLKPRIDSIETLLAAQNKIQDLFRRLDEASVGGHFVGFVRLLRLTDHPGSGRVPLFYCIDWVRIRRLPARAEIVTGAPHSEQG